MTIPDKPIEIDLDTIGLDAWIAFSGAATALQGMKGRDLSTMHQALTGAREILITFLTPSWTEEEIGALNLAEMKEVFGQIGAAMRGPKSMSDSPSPQPTAMEVPSLSVRGSAGSRKNGIVRPGRSRPRSA